MFTHATLCASHDDMTSRDCTTARASDRDERTIDRDERKKIISSSVRAHGSANARSTARARLCLARKVNRQRAGLGPTPSSHDPRSRCVRLSSVRVWNVSPRIVLYDARTHRSSIEDPDCAGMTDRPLDRPTASTASPSARWPRETSARRALAIMRRALALVSVDDDDLVGRRGRALLGAYLNSDPDNQVYVFMFAFSVLLFSVPPLLKLKRCAVPARGGAGGVGLRTRDRRSRAESSFGVSARGRRAIGG